MLARWLRAWERKLLKPLLFPLTRLGMGPDMVTLAGLVVIVISGLMLSRGYLLTGACLLLAGGLLDAADGELARLTGRETSFGGFLDSVADHCGDFAVYLGLLWLSLNNRMGSEVVLIFVAFFGSVFGSLIRSRASMAGVDARDVGLFTRFERILLLALGLLSGKTTAALWVLAVLNNFSAAQRLAYVMRVSRLSRRN
ncbi:MAG TPA: CDP-alcohol phosphatidyltransferase family protein [Syntrophorhabdaceae bacterium]